MTILVVLTLEESMVSEGGGSAGRKTFALVLLCSASLVAVLDLTIVAVGAEGARFHWGSRAVDPSTAGVACSWVGSPCSPPPLSLEGWRGRPGCWWWRASCRV